MVPGRGLVVCAGVALVFLFARPRAADVVVRLVDVGGAGRCHGAERVRRRARRITSSTRSAAERRGSTTITTATSIS